MKYWNKWIHYGTIILSVSATWFIWELSPNHLSQSTMRPVLAMPQSSDPTIPNDGSSYSFQLHRNSDPQTSQTTSLDDQYSPSVSMSSPETAASDQPKPKTKPKEDTNTFYELILGINSLVTEKAKADVNPLSPIVSTDKK